MFQSVNLCRLGDGQTDIPKPESQSLIRTVKSMEPDSTTHSEQDLEIIEILQLSDSGEEKRDLEDFLQADSNEENLVPANRNPPSSSNSSSIKVIDLSDAKNGDMDIEEAPQEPSPPAESPNDSDDDTVRLEAPRIPTPPPWNPLLPERD